MHYGDKQKVAKFIEDDVLNKAGNIDKGKKEKKISLPKGITIGTEIECEGVSSRNIKELSNIIAPMWECKRDGSLSDGVEVTSPILHSENEGSSEEVYRVCNILKALNQRVSERCGGHIHIGAHTLTSPDSYRKLLEMWSNIESTLYVICNETGDIPRIGVQRYASPISGKIEEAIESGEIFLKDGTDLNMFLWSLKSIQEVRYSGINFLNVNNSKNTIEFRLANGTLNPETWIENINLFGGFVAAAEQISQIDKKEENSRTEEEKQKMETFEILRNETATPTEKLKALLTLTVPEEEIQVYLDRYKTNISLTMKNFTMDSINDKVAKKSIKLTKKDIGKESLAGENPITGEEYLRSKKTN